MTTPPPPSTPGTEPASPPRRDVLEHRRLQLEVEEAERRLDRGARESPAWWPRSLEVGKYLVVAVPVLLSVATFYLDHRRAQDLKETELALLATDLELKRSQLELNREELDDKRRAALSFGLDKLKEFPEAATLYLSLYPDRSTQVLLGMVRVEPGGPGSSWPWPATSWAALEALQRIGPDHLTEEDRDHLRELLKDCDSAYDRMLGLSSEKKRGVHSDVRSGTEVAVGIARLLGDDAKAKSLRARVEELEDLPDS